MSVFSVSIISSNASSLPEVAGKAAILVDPYEPKSICRGLQEVLEHKEKVIELQIEAQKQVKKFSWDQAARETLKVLEEAA